jgi:PAS domain S-box-containing protein
MDTKYLSFSLIGAPALGNADSCFVSGHGSNVWQENAGAIVAEDREDVSHTRTTKATQFTGNFGQAVMPSGMREVADDTSSEALWINEQGQILDCAGSIAELFGYWKDELKGQHISVLVPDLTDTLFLQYSSPTRLWVDDQGQILDCSGPIEEIFGYWKNELKGEHISMLLPDLAHTELLELDDGDGPRVAAQSHDAIAFEGVKPEGDENAYSVFLQLISAKAGRELSVILRSQVH